MKSLIFILLTQFVVAQQIPIDSISYEYFYEKELQQITLFKLRQLGKPYNAKAQFEIAELYAKINCEDSAYATYYKIYEYEKVKRSFSENKFKELLFQLHNGESSKHDYTKDRRAFLSELDLLSKNDKTDKWRAIVSKERATDYVLDSTNLNLGYTNTIALQNTNYYKQNFDFKSRVLLNLGNFNTDRENYTKAKNLLLESYIVAYKSNNYTLQVYAKINLAVNEIQQKNYKLALEYLNEIEEIPNNKFKVKINRIVHKLKKRAYDGLEDTENAENQELYIKKYDSLINDFQKNSNFYEIDVAYQLKEKDKKIKELNKSRTLFSILLFGVFLLALYSFVRWKKSDRKKRILNQENQSLNLENEKAKTELETVKSLVINDYVVLKNKSKVYLKELIYVKSDGHYLNLYTTSKKEFVRGKISEIEQQLPPNFIKCHRSHIVL